MAPISKRGSFNRGKRQQRVSRRISKLQAEKSKKNEQLDTIVPQQAKRTVVTARKPIRGKALSSAKISKKIVTKGKKKNATKGKVSAGKKQIVKKTVVRVKEKHSEQETEVVKKQTSRSRKKQLVPRPGLTSYDQDPFFESKGVPIPFVSVSNYSKASIKAVLMNDEALLKKLLSDKRNVHSLHLRRSIDMHFDSLTYALAQNKVKLAKILLDDMKKPVKDRAPIAKSLIARQNTGQYNFHMLGHAVRQIQMSRGGKEGTNALLKDEKEADQLSGSAIVEAAIRYGADLLTLTHLIADGSFGQLGVDLGQNVVVAIRWGRRKLAAQLIKDFASSYFNELGHQVLINDQGKPLMPFKAISVKKKALFNKFITPVHCAAINPNPKYIKELLSVDPDFNHADTEGYKPIHYAAVNESSDVLLFLLEKGASPYDSTKKVGYTPLHLACEANRQENAKILCQYIKRVAPENLISCVRHKTKNNGFTAVHLAARQGYVKVLQVLREFVSNDVTICDDHSTAVSQNATPLMVAAQQGHLATVRFLHEEAHAAVEARDKLKRTPLMYAAMNGHSTVVSYLLRIGVDANCADSSGNTAAHYAAAYGWYFCLKLLIEADADLCKSNDWLLSPLSVAYMKGHMALADMILQQTNIDINCKDALGLTLVALTIVSGIDKGTLDQLDYLINRKHADANLADAKGNNAFHHLAEASVMLSQMENESAEKYEQRQSDLRLAVARILLNVGCNASQLNEDNQSPFHLALRKGFLDLAFFLLNETDVRIQPCDLQSCNNFKENFMFDLVKHSGRPLSLEIFELLVNKNQQEIKFYLNFADSNGFTPFLSCCNYYTMLTTVDDQSACQNFVQFLLQIYPHVIGQHVQLEKCSHEPQQTENADESASASGDSSQSYDDYDGDNNSTKDADAQNIKDVNDTESNDAIFEKENIDNRDTSTVTLADCKENAFHLLAGFVEVENTGKRSSIKPYLLDILLKHAKQVSAGRPMKSADDATGQRLADLLECFDKDGQSPLYRAVVRANVSAAKMLIEYGADVNFSQANVLKGAGKADPSVAIGTSVLMAAVKSKNIDMTKFLLQKKVKLAHADTQGNTALHYACMDTKMTEIVKLVLKAKAPWLQNVKGRYPIHLICNADRGGADDSIETLEELLNNDCLLNQTDQRGRLPLHYAFVKIGRHTDSSFIDPVAVVTTIIQRMQFHNQNSSSLSDYFGRTPLHYAAYRGANISCLVLLSIKDKQGRCPFDVNAEDSEGNTPFGLALAKGHYACSLTLLQAGCRLLQSVCLDQNNRLDEETYKKLIKYRWAPVAQPFKQKEIVSSARLIVRQNWQGILHLMIQQLVAVRDGSVVKLVEAAFRERKYNLALAILRQIDPNLLNVAVNQTADKMANLMQILADTAAEEYESELQLKIMDILSAKFKIDMDGHGANWDSCHVAFYAARRRNFRLLDYIEQNAKTKLKLLQPLSDGQSIASSFFIEPHQWTDEQLKWLYNFVQRHNFNFDVLASYTIPLDLTKSNVQNKNADNVKDVFRVKKITPLIRSILDQNFKLVQSLLKSGFCDVNFVDSESVTPLMYSVIVNNGHLIKLLLNFDYKIANDDQSIANENEDVTDDADLNTPNVPAVLFNASGLKRKLFPGAKGPQKTKRSKSTSKSGLFLKTSPINLLKTDNRGRNVMHYLVEPLPLGSWQNIEICHILLNVYDWTTDEARFSTVRDEAYKRGLNGIAEEFEKKIKGKFNAARVNYASFWSYDEQKNEQYEIELGKLQLDVDVDAKRFIVDIQSIKAQNKNTLMDKILKPYHLSGLSETGQIIEDINTKRRLSILLTKMDRSGPYGFYNFYRMQLIREKGRELYILFTNWGRMGDTNEGQHQKTSFTKLEDGVKEFCSIFRSKTGNEWPKLEDLSQFEPKPAKYRLILDDESAFIENTDISERGNLKLNVPANLVSYLPDDLKLLLTDLTDFESIQKSVGHSMRRSHRFNFPLVVPSLKRDLILDARKILEDIAALVTKLNKTREELSKAVGTQKEIIDKCHNIYEDIAKRSCEFYHLLPLKGFAYSKIKIIEDTVTVDEYIGLVNNLLEYERANHILRAAASYYNRNPAVHPYDYVFKALNCRIKPMQPCLWESQHILHYIHNTAPRCNVQCVYKIYDAKKESEFNPKHLQNRKLLWHGTGAENLMGVLTQGLVPCPFQANQAGQLFGKGVYTADTFEKSRGYCRPSSSKTMYMLLCEVALGRCKEVTQDLNDHKVDILKNGYNSLMGMGRNYPDPIYDLTLPTGATIPLGELVERKADDEQWFYLHNNEYVCYDPSQIIIRYLVAFKHS